MNYINRLQSDLTSARAQQAAVASELNDLLSYLSSDKFGGPDCDYIHIRTDLMPKLMALRSTLTDPDFVG